MQTPSARCTPNSNPSSNRTPFSPPPPPASSSRPAARGPRLPAAAIARAGKAFGMPMGPIELTDVVGLDVSLHVGRVLAGALQRRVPEVLIKRVEQKKLGRKSGGD